MKCALFLKWLQLQKVDEGGAGRGRADAFRPCVQCVHLSSVLLPWPSEWNRVYYWASNGHLVKGEPLKCFILAWDEKDGYLGDNLEKCIGGRRIEQ